MKKDEVWFKMSRLINPLIAFYFFVAFIEIIAEYNSDYFFIRFSRPFVIPLLMAVYLVSAKVKNKYYLIALFLVFISNIFIFSDEIALIVIRSVFLFLSQLIFIYLVIQKVKFPGSRLVFIGSFPYACICLLVLLLINNSRGIESLLFIIQLLIITFFGGLSLANYLTKYSKLNSQLLSSASLLFLAQLLVILKSVYSNNAKIEALSTVFLVIGNYIFYLFILGQERKQKKFKIVN